MIQLTVISDPHLTENLWNVSGMCNIFFFIYFFLEQRHKNQVLIISPVQAPD